MSIQGRRKHYKQLGRRVFGSEIEHFSGGRG